jgi:tRNA isopentenyl-2-thiomethyl-A-37 hydroxylase MiaE
MIVSGLQKHVPVEELARMTTIQIIDIYEREKKSMRRLTGLDAEELRHLIMQFRGSRTPPMLLNQERPGAFAVS